MLDALADRDLLILEDDGFRFKSELVRDVAYGTLTRAERARRHADLTDRLHDAENRIEVVAHHLATAAELVADLGSVPGMPSDIRNRAITALMAAAAPVEATENWIASGRLFDRALMFLGPEDVPRRWTALLGRARARDAARELDDAHDDALAVLEEATEAEDATTVAHALSVLGRIESDAGRYEDAEATLWRAVDAWRALDDTSGVAGALRGLGVINLFRGEHAEAERLTSEALASFRKAGDQRGEAWALQNLAWISFSQGRLADAEGRLNESAERFAELGDWGGLGWALGLLAFARFNQGNLDEAENLASQILTEAHETGDRWAAGMMKVLLANIALWRGRAEHSMERGNEALALFRDIHDRWGEVMAAVPTIRALNNLTRFRECDELVALVGGLVETMHDPAMRRNANGLQAAVSVHRGDPETAARAIEELGRTDEDAYDIVGDVDRALITGLTLLQSSRVGEAVGAARERVREGHRRRSSLRARERARARVRRRRTSRRRARRVRGALRDPRWLLPRSPLRAPRRGLCVRAAGRGQRRGRRVRRGADRPRSRPIPASTARSSPSRARTRTPRSTCRRGTSSRPRRTSRSTVPASTPRLADRVRARVAVRARNRSSS